MKFQHDDDIWKRFDSLTVVALVVRGLRPDLHLEPVCSALIESARNRLAQHSEGTWPAIQAWRRTFASMGMKPTQFRCAAESLLRRLRKDGDLPRVHPLVDLCNSISVAYGLPVASLDVERVSGNLLVRSATGNEEHVDFSGGVESPEPGEIVFVDDANRTHARRWCHRQSALSIIRPETQQALVVIEAMHVDATDSVLAAGQAIAAALTATGAVCSSLRLLSRLEPRFDMT